MKKLLMISGDRSLAIGKHGAFYNTLEEFHKHWGRIDIICPQVRNYQSKIDLPLVKNPKVFFGNVFIHSSPWPLIFQPFWIFKKGLEIYKNQKFDIMTVHEYPPFYNGIGARLLWNRIKVPYVLEIMHIPGYPRAVSIKEKIYKILLRFFIKSDSSKANGIRVINKNQVSDFLIKAGIANNKLFYIPAFYIDLNVFKPISSVEKKYDLIFIARFEKNKGINLLFQAITNIICRSTDQASNIRLLIVGSGPLRTDLENYVKKNKLGHNVDFSGWLTGPEDVARAMNSAKIFINPSFNEGGPRVVLEAMACGLPIITTRVGLMLDIIHDGENGLFIDWTSKDMADKIIRLIEDKELQNKFSEVGLELVKQFEKERAVSSYANKLQSLI